MPRLALAGAARDTDGAASSTGIGAVSTGCWPLVGSDCGPLRYGKKSTELEVVPPETVSSVAVPLTGFSGVCGLVVGEMAGPGLVSELKRRPHQLPSALSRLPWLASGPEFGLPVTAVVPSAARFITPYALSTMLLVPMRE